MCHSMPSTKSISTNMSKLVTLLKVLRGEKFDVIAEFNFNYKIYACFQFNKDRFLDGIRFNASCCVSAKRLSPALSTIYKNYILIYIHPKHLPRG